MISTRVSSLLHDDYRMLQNHVEGKRIAKVLSFTENNITLLMEDDIIVDFVQLEDEIITDIKLPQA